MNKSLAYFLSGVKYLIMLSLYGGFGTVVYGVYTMNPPKELWPTGFPPVSPAVSATVNLSVQFFVIYLALAIVRTVVQLRGPQQWLTKLEASLQLAGYTVNMAPMLCILFVGARMRALQIDPKNGAPQAWAQNSFYLCAYSVLVQALLVVFLPYCVSGVTCKKGDFEGDVKYEGLTGTVAQVLTVIRYLCLLSLYGGFSAVMVSVFTIENKADPSLTPKLSPAMACVMNLAVQYFGIYLILFLAQTWKQFASDSKTATTVAQVATSARQTVMYAPMLAVLYIGCRMRALQLTRANDGTIPVGAGPQTWVQDCMFLGTWAVLIQVILVAVLSIQFPVEMDADGNVKTPSDVNPIVAVCLNTVRYGCMIAMYGGAVGVLSGVATMTPETLPPYAEVAPLVPGLPVVQPPNPPTPSF
jgi:hypothetical protein